LGVSEAPAISAGVCANDAAESAQNTAIIIAQIFEKHMEQKYLHICKLPLNLHPHVLLF